MNRYEIRDLKKSRDKQINNLSKLLKLLVAAEWEMITIANEKSNNIIIKLQKQYLRHQRVFNYQFLN